MYGRVDLPSCYVNRFVGLTVPADGHWYIPRKIDPRLFTATPVLAFDTLCCVHNLCKTSKSVPCFFQGKPRI
jgi:hypothetical protein